MQCLQQVRRSKGEMMMAIDPIGKIVGHKVFGKGKIINVYSNASSNLISVQFEKETKSFAYPGAF